MRYAALVGLIAFTGLAGCGPTYTATVLSGNGSTVGTTGITPMTGPECVPKDNDPARCTNLLPAGWQMFAKADLATLVGTVKTMIAGSGVVKQDRLVSQQCVGKKSAQKIKVTYWVPAEAMALFPTTGTNGRDLVIGVMAADTPEGCWTGKYGIQQTLAGATRLIQFLTVSTNPGTWVSGVDRRVGEWKAWSLVQDAAGNISVVQTDNGAFVSCGHKHYVGGKETHAFISCDDAGVLATYAAALADSTHAKAGAVFDSLLVARQGGATLSILSGDPSNDSAWSRCGNLGCCAAE